MEKKHPPPEPRGPLTVFHPRDKVPVTAEFLGYDSEHPKGDTWTHRFTKGRRFPHHKLPHNRQVDSYRLVR